MIQMKTFKMENYRELRESLEGKINYQKIEYQVGSVLARIKLNGINEKELIPFLSKDELEKADRYRLYDDKKRSVITRGFLRLMLSDCLDQCPQTIRFSCTQYGRPYLHESSADAKIDFNVSHSSEQIVIGISHGARIGVDIEEKKSIRNMDSIIKRFADDVTFSLYKKHDKSQKAEFFYKWWTRTEAFLKAKGTGISGLKNTEFKNCSYLESFDTDGYVFSVCIL